MSASLGDLIPEFSSYAQGFVDYVGSFGLLPRITSTLRSSSEQRRLYEKFIAGGSAYPAAPPGTSAHEFGFAFDMVLSPMAALSDVGSVWEQLGGVWGGRNHDPIHFEWPGFKSFLASGRAGQTSGEGLVGGVAGFLFDFASGFIPGVGEAEVFAAILQLFPQFSDSQVLDLIANPHKLLRLLVQYL